MYKPEKYLKYIGIILCGLILLNIGPAFAQNIPGKAPSKEQTPAQKQEPSAPRYNGSSKSDGNYGSGHVRRKQKMRKRTRYNQ